MSEEVDVGLAAEVRRLTRALAEAASTTRDNTSRIDLIADLETLKCAAEAAQAVATADLYDATVADHAAQGVPAARRGRGVAQQIGFARRESARRATMHLGLARAVVGSGADVEGLPGLRDAWSQGVVTEYRVAQIAAKLVHLSAEDRAAVDAELAGTPEKVDQLRRWGDREAIAVADQAAYERDRAGYVRRRRAAEADRHVSGRPAPDTMMRLSALLAVKDGVAVLAALKLAAEEARNAGDPRSRGQVMADTLVGRVTGRDPATAPVGVIVDVTVPLDALLDDGPDAQASGWLAGYGAVPADLARSLAADAVETGGLFRRLFTDPAGRLVAMESAARLFPLLLALFLRRRDRFCRNPWCEAPIRHHDHVTAVGEGGPTSAENGQGLCESCNHAKQAPGWRTKARTDADGTHVVETITPTGHVYESRPPPTGRRREQVEEYRRSGTT